MNIRDFILERGPETDIGSLADEYVKEALELEDEEERKAALAPAVRSLVSTVASSLRKARRGQPAPSPDDGQAANGGPVHQANDGQQQDGEPVQSSNDSDRSNGGTSESWLSWLRDNSRATFWIPGTGKKLAADITADEWDRRAVWLENTARGMAKSAAECREAARVLRRSGVTCGRELL